MANSGPNGEWLVSSENWPGELPVIGWQIWYTGGHDIRSSEMSWEDAPTHGVQVVVAHHPGGRRTLCNAKDEYTFPGHTVTKFGEEIDFNEYQSIYLRAIKDSWRVG